MRKAALAIALVLPLAACAGLQKELEKANIWANKYGPIIGKDIIMVSNILVQAECSPALAASSATAGNILKIVAPDSNRVNTVVGILNTNVKVADQLCPLLTAVKGSIGSVPNVQPSQTVTVQ